MYRGFPFLRCRKPESSLSGHSATVQFAVSIIRANCTKLSEPGALALIASAVGTVDRDTRRAEFPSKTMKRLVQGLERIKIDDSNVGSIIQLTSHLCDDKVWRAGDVVSKLAIHFADKQISIFPFKTKCILPSVWLT